MIRPQKPKRERERVADLFALNLLDTPPEERYDRLTRELAVLLKVPIAYLALIDSNRQWLKSTVGTMPCQSDRDASFCAHTILSDQPLVVADTRRDPRFADNPLVKQEPFVRFYAGVPLRSSGGNNVGTLCIADRKPRRLGDHDLEILKAFAALIEKQVNASPQIFISYSHSDEDWKDRLTSHLGVLRNEDLLNFWDDRKIGAGDGWRGEIQQAMESSNLAVLLISANFLTSQFIKDVEVPRLLSRREKEGLVVLPIILKPCCWDQVEWLREMNVYPNDARPISSGTASQIDTDLAGFASRVLEGLGAPRGTARPASTRVDDADKVLRDIGFSTKGSRSESADAPSGKSLETSGLKLLVKKKDDATVQPDSCLFHQDCITIGRDPDNDLPLCDDGRVVSKRHAEIVRTGAKVYLTDLASKNFTFLNGKRIEPEGRFEFDAADTIEIGPFEIRCNVVHAADATEEPNVDEQTAFSADFVNPFLDGAGRFAAVLNEIEQQYGSESPTRRRDALEKALQAAMEGQGDHETRAVVADVLGRLLKSDSGKPKWTACEPWWNQESISCALSGG